MTDLDFSRCRLEPFPHQKEDTQAVVSRPFYFIASECRTGKTKIIIDAAQFLFEAGTIDKMIVITPAAVRGVWCERQFGELAKHLWLNLPATVIEFHARNRIWQHGPAEAPRRLIIYVSNFEFIRSKNRLTDLLAACGPKTMLVGDESSSIKNYSAAQTKAFLHMRQKCGRVYLLNGTPLYHSPLDLFSQGNILSPTILDCKYVTQFKARYALMTPVLGHGGKPLPNPRGGGFIQKITGWTNLDDLQARFAKHTVRRLQSTLNLPPKLDPVMLTATLTKETWRAYRDMRDELVVWLNEQDVAAAGTAAIKVLRLSQITSGFVGGVEDARIGEDRVEEGLLASLQLGGTNVGMGAGQATGGDRSRGGLRDRPLADRRVDVVQAIGREKLDVLIWFLKLRLEEDPQLKVVVWHRFRPEAERTAWEIAKLFHSFDVAMLIGGQPREERRRALSLLKPETAPEGPVLISGTAGSGSFGLDFSAAHTCVTMSCGYSPGQAAQMLDRVYGPGQIAPIAYYDIVAVGPSGQRTIDHAILSARRAGEDVANWTSNAWVRALEEE